MRLKDKVVLVTGSTTGIGEGMVRVFSREGATVIVHGTRERAAKELVAEIQKAGGKASYTIGSLADPSVPARVIAESIAQWGRLDGLVNNAAVMTRGSMENIDLEAWDKTIAVNLRAPFLLIQAALPQFRKQGGGVVVNIGSINAYCGERDQFAYAVAKGGFMTLTRNIADAYGSEGIRVNLLNVGWTLTPNEYELKKKEGLPDDWPQRLPKSSAPNGRILLPEDVALGALYFLSDESCMVNGSILDLEQFPLIGRNAVKETK